MDIGMLWYDNDPKNDLVSKVSRAAAYYQKKYGQVPDLCFVHPSMIQGELSKAGRIDVKANRSVLPHHFWIGVNSFSSKAG